MNTQETAYWKTYLQTLDNPAEQPSVSVGIAGNPAIADDLLALYLTAQKTAGSGLLKDYQLAGDPLPQVGDHWIILDSQAQPRCIVKTVRVEQHRFAQVPEAVAIAEGEGDLSLAYWRAAHLEFFKPFLADWGITDLEQETVVTEYYELVYPVH